MLSEDTGGEHIEKAHREQERNHVMLRFTQHDMAESLFFVA